MRSVAIVIGLAAALALVPAQRAVAEGDDKKEPQAEKPAQPEPSSALERAMRDEMERALTLKLPGTEEPFYVSYWVEEAEEATLMAEYGGVVDQNRWRRRTLRLDVRVGARDFGVSSASVAGPYSLALDDDYQALRRQLWLATDEAYKAAADQLEKRRTARANKEGQENIAEFSETKPLRTELPSPGSEKVSVDLAPFAPMARNLSAVFAGYPYLQEAHVEMSWRRTRRLFASSEGAFASAPSSVVELRIEARAQAGDGMPLGHRIVVTMPAPGDLPDEKQMLQRVKKMADELTAMRAAPTIADYSGPILFEGAAAAQLLSRVLVDNLSGTPPGDDADFTLSAGPDTPLARKLGKRVLPTTINIVDDPLARDEAGAPLLGSYGVDDEGVRPEKVNVVEAGRLRNFLMSRTPRKEFPRSNGHGRMSSSGAVKAQIGNLFVRADKRLARPQLIRRLLAEARAAGEEYALVVKQLEDPARMNDADVSTLVKESSGEGTALLMPLVVYRVKANGSEELVRGIVLDGVSVRSLRDILATGRNTTVWNTVSDSNPVSIVAPDLLIEEVDARSRKGPHPRVPVLKSPLAK